MKKILILSLCFFISGCSLLETSDGENIITDYPEPPETPNILQSTYKVKEDVKSGMNQTILGKLVYVNRWTLWEIFK